MADTENTSATAAGKADQNGVKSHGSSAEGVDLKSSKPAVGQDADAGDEDEDEDEDEDDEEYDDEEDDDDDDDEEEGDDGEEQGADGKGADPSTSDLLREVSV